MSNGEFPAISNKTGIGRHKLDQFSEINIAVESSNEKADRLSYKSRLRCRFCHIDDDCCPWRVQISNQERVCLEDDLFSTPMGSLRGRMKKLP